jgi:hypothetical protein
LTKSVFSVSCRSIARSADLWIAGGEGSNNTLAYSRDGKQWTGLGTSIFSTACHHVAYNGLVWVAVGAGSANSLAVSTDGLVWTGLGKTVFSTAGTSVDWNGHQWLATGNGTSNTMAVSANGSAWTGLGNSVLATAPNHVRWANSQWMVAAGATDASASYVAVTTDLSSAWTYVQLPLTNCRKLAWNGREVVAVGSGGGVAVSVNGTTGWALNTDLSYNHPLNAVEWSGKEWILGGENAEYYVGLCGPNAGDVTVTSAVSTGACPLDSVLCVGVRPTVGAYVSDNALFVKRGDKLVVYGPAVYDHAVANATVTMNLYDV